MLQTFRGARNSFGLGRWTQWYSRACLLITFKFVCVAACVFELMAVRYFECMGCVHFSPLQKHRLSEGEAYG